MRLPLRAMLVVALLAGQAHAQSNEALSTPAAPAAGTVVDRPSAHVAGAPDGGTAGAAGMTSGQDTPSRLNADRQSVWITVFARSLASAEDRLGQIWTRLGQRNWILPLLALFSGLVAIFAYVLWRSTSSLIGIAKEQSRDLKDMIVVAREAADAAKRSADAASLQARAMVVAELPRLELRHAHLVCSDQSVRQALKAPSVDLRFTNYGRTTALVLEKCIEVRLGQSLPPDPAYDFIEAFPVVEAVERSGSFGAEAPRRLGELSESQVQGLLGGLNNLWVYGFIRFRDFLGMQHKLGFCMRWMPPRDEASIGGMFVPEDPGAYIYQNDDWAPAPTESEPSRPAPPHSELHLAAAAE